MKRLVLQEIGKQAVQAQVGEAVIVAVDLSRSKWVYACRWGGQEQRRLSSPAELPHLQAMVREYQGQGCEVHVVYEACGFGYQIAWWVEERGAKVLVVAPSTVEKAPGSRVKTDGLDAGALALHYERGMLKGIYIPRRREHELRQLSRTYTQVVGGRKRQQTRLRLLLQEHGYTSPPPALGWKPLREWVAQQTFAPAVQMCVEQLLTLREGAARSATQLQTELREVARLPPYAAVVKALASQSGVGRLTAIRFILEVGDIHRFPTGGSIANYFGLTPGEYSSGETVHRGRIRKCGPGFVRGWLIECAWAALRSKKDAALAQCFERLAPRAGRKRAIVAVARRLALRLRARWLEAEQSPFAP